MEAGLGRSASAVLGQAFVDARMVTSRFQEGHRIAHHRLPAVVELLVALLQSQKDQIIIIKKVNFYVEISVFS